MVIIKTELEIIEVPKIEEIRGNLCMDYDGIGNQGRVTSKRNE